jgi:hypothetical protein
MKTDKIPIDRNPAGQWQLFGYCFLILQIASINEILLTFLLYEPGVGESAPSATEDHRRRSTFAASGSAGTGEDRMEW